MSWAEDVCNLSLMDEDGGLTRPNDQLRPLLDLVAVARETPDQSVLAVVDPFDDID